MEYRVTICTPIYNRAYKILELYESLKLQKNKNFEWIIIDDGSTDEIDEKINIIRKENLIKFLYEKKENGGKHTAINKGMELAKGELFFIVDSDDILTEECIDKIIQNWDSIENKSGFIGVSGNRGYKINKVIGDELKEKFIDCTAFDLRYKFKIKGDKAEAFELEKLKKYKFPEFEGEKFLTEAIVWNRIAKDGYLLRWFNDIIYITEYLDDGLTKKYDYLMANNINATKIYYSELLDNCKFLSSEERDRAKIEYVKYLFLNRYDVKRIKEDITDLNNSILFKGYIQFKWYTLKKIIKKVIK